MKYDFVLNKGVVRFGEFIELFCFHKFKNMENSQDGNSVVI